VESEESDARGAQAARAAFKRVWLVVVKLPLDESKLRGLAALHADSLGYKNRSSVMLSALPIN
jgi:hypothetical protein